MEHFSTFRRHFTGSREQAYVPASGESRDTHIRASRNLLELLLRKIIDEIMLAPPSSGYGDRWYR